MTLRWRLAKLAIVTCVICFTVVSRGTVDGQSCPPIAIQTPADTVTILVKTENNSCTVTNGGYIKAGVNDKLHAIAHSEGKCQTRTLSQGQCVNLGQPYNRTLYGTLTDVNGSPQGAIVNSGPVWDYDSTTIPSYQCSGGKLYPLVGVGTHIYTSYTNTTPTPCNFPNAGPADNQPITMHALQCKPPFNEQQVLPNPVVVPHLQPSAIDIYLRSEMPELLEPLAAAIANWNDNLTGAVPTLNNPTTTDCGAGATCVRFEEGLIPPVEGVFPCSTFSISYNPSTGELVSASIKMQEGWWNVNAGRLQRTAAHELGHLFGLKEADQACAGANSIMRTGVYACDASSVPNAITMNDAIPVQKGVYDGEPRASCGF